MPRLSRDTSPDAAAQAVRQRFASRMAGDTQTSPLLELPAEDPPGSAGHEEPGAHVRSVRLRWRTPWRVAVLLAVVAAGLIVWHLWQSSLGQPTSEPLDSSTSVGPEAPDPSESPEPAGSEAQGSLLVHVAGAVKKPGVISLPLGSRVFQAIDAAGGAATNAELGGLNLAEVLNDGVKIVVPVVGEAPQPAPSALAGSGAATGNSSGGSTKVNLNTASLEELGTLPRVGPVTAQRILDWRKEHGAFASVDELDAIDGIGPKLMESLKDLVTVQGG
ncbi:helix-hairpin-helix domain-containing protein [Arthrobacter sp. AK01]|uniref:helix-hairpin-helix domain-containing protein n=1 Tax=Micrococcaceae TaxID=1268 RepID=UPI001E2E4C00|nr:MULTISPECIES: helix-hairpin-helix domain-containing protein [Micrococcaceae]MCD4850888.1 helix-hairpin-helix domain-containing protein [Arthrobacter sp. AK01]MCP1414216.1 competence protein ComEA [Paenarthrobacter sp. A20]